MRDVVDNNGASTKHIEYNSFGEREVFGSGPEILYSWTGREYDVEAELQYNRARWYDPKVGRWLSTDPIGFDAGANAGNTFVLVYNLFDSEDLYKRYPAGEGAAYLLGGFNASYLRRGDVVLIPIRVGVGARLGVNAGYMKFRKKQNWVPF